MEGPQQCKPLMIPGAGGAGETAKELLARSEHNRNVGFS